MRRVVACGWGAPAITLALVLAACGSEGDKAGQDAAPEPTAIATASESPTVAGAGLGGLFQVGDRKLYLDCQGEGSPVVILEPGQGGTRGDVAGLASGLSPQSMVCSYDRAGLGQSDDPATTPRTSADAVEDLHGLLGAAGVAPPYVLAGVSAGGSFVLHFARAHPDEVVGVVAMNEVPLYDDWSRRAYPLLTDLQVDDEESYYSGDNDEDFDWIASSREHLKAPAPGGVPMVLLHSSVAQCEGEPDTGPCHLTADLYLDLGREYAAAWPGATFEAVEAGHQIQLEEPEMVLQLLEGMVTQARA